MAVRPKPNASYASNRLTRDYNGHLLSQVEGRMLHEDSRDTKTMKRAPEPATDDEPLSSDDESSASQASLEGDDPVTDKETGNADGTQSKIGRSRGELQEIRRSTRLRPAVTEQQQEQQPLKRPCAQPMDQEKDEWNMWSSQESKKPRKICYGSSGPKNIHASSSFQTPSSSLENMVSPKKPEPSFKNPKRFPGFEESPVKKPKENEADGFVIPREFDLLSPIPKSQGAEFKEPLALPSNSIPSSSLASDNQMNDFDAGSPLSSLGSISSGMSLSQTPEPIENPSLCPMCKEPVDRELLQEFLLQPNQRVREQQRFCEGHKKQSAEKEWSNKGYPTIKWETFDERIRHHFPSLDKILVPDSPSYYRNILESTMKAGKAKNFRLTISGDSLENMSCGYYGSKGASQMLNAVTTEFSHKLRRLAVFDNVVKTAGVAAYAQAVLVPELAVLLVKEDMDVSDEGARRILRESMTIGEKLNAAPNDVIPVQDA